jgi:hypothetical protein
LDFFLAPPNQETIDSQKTKSTIKEQELKIASRKEKTS